MRAAPDEPDNPWLAGDGRRGADYDRRWADLAAGGRNVHGEADLVESLLAGPPGPRSVLDAGCGTGRVAVELAARGLEVVGVDLDPSMLRAARDKRPDLRWVAADLADPVGMALDRTFDVAVMAGNVMIFVTPGTEGRVLANVAALLRPGGLLVAGFSLRPGGLDLATYDRLAGDAGLEPVDRWATWDREPFVPGSDYAVSVHRRPLTTEAR